MLNDFRPQMGDADAYPSHNFSTDCLAGAPAQPTKPGPNEASLSEPSSTANRKLFKANLRDARDRVLTYEEQFHIARAAWECHYPVVEQVIALMVETAMRPGELKHARWSDVDSEAGVITLKDGRRVPLTSSALTALAGLDERRVSRPNPLIVPLNYSALQWAFRRVCEDAGVRNFRLSDLRHTALTRIANLTGDLKVVRMMAGFKSLSPLKRYVNLPRYEFDMSRIFDRELFEATTACWSRVTDMSCA